MMKTVLIPVLLALSINIFAQTEKINQTDNQGRKQGHWIKMLQDTIVLYDGYFKDDKPVGEMKRYFETGELKAIMNFSDDGRTADTKLYYQNGELAAEGLYIDGIKDGDWKYYSFYDKTLTSEETLKMGKKYGEEKKYYQNGNLSESTFWVNDVKHGPWKQLYEDGQTKAEAEFVYGKINGKYTVYRNNGSLEVVGYYNMNRMDGIWSYYNEKGEIERELKFNNGVPENKEQLTKEEQEFFELIEQNKGKFDEPSIDDLMQTPQQR